jgi:mevalonate kinase
MNRLEHHEALASATGKLILSGEHAVVFGAPALAMGTKCRVRTQIIPTDDGRAAFDLPDLDVHLTFHAEELVVLHDQLVASYQSFLEEKITIDEVLNHPVELIPFAFAAAWNHLGRPSFDGLRVDMDFGIPIGCGMGSSAALGISILKATGRYFHSPLNDTETFDLSMRCEQLMHGHPSGVDSNVSLYGGAFRFQDGNLEPRPVPEWEFQLFNTGRPESSTGECVESVRSRFKETDAIWGEFTEVTEALDAMAAQSTGPELLDLIRRNHALLCRIGVVPDRVQRIIRHVEDLGGAAKITGAGAVHGNDAGAILVFGDVKPDALDNFGVEHIEGC